MHPREQSFPWTLGPGNHATGSTPLPSPYFGGMAPACAPLTPQGGAQAQPYPQWVVYAAPGAVQPGSPAGGMGPILRSQWQPYGIAPLPHAPLQHMMPPYMEWLQSGARPLAGAAPEWGQVAGGVSASFPATHAGAAQWRGPARAPASSNSAPRSRKRATAKTRRGAATSAEARTLSSDTAGSDGSDSDYVDPSWKRRRQGAPSAEGDPAGAARPVNGDSLSRRRSSSEAEDHAFARSRDAQIIMRREKELVAAVPGAWIYPSRRDGTRGPLPATAAATRARAAWEGVGAAAAPVTAVAYASSEEVGASAAAAAAPASTSGSVSASEGGQEEGNAATQSLAAHAEGVAPYSQLRGRARHAQRERMRWQYIAALGERLRGLLLQEKRAAYAKALEIGSEEVAKAIPWDEQSFLSRLRVTTPRIHVVEAAVDFIRLQLGLHSAPVSPKARPQPTLQERVTRFRQALYSLGALGSGTGLLAHDVALLVAEDGAVVDGTRDGRELLRTLRRRFEGTDTTHSPSAGDGDGPEAGPDNAIDALPAMKGVFARLVERAATSSAAPLALRMPDGVEPPMLLVSLVPALPAAPTMSEAEGWEAAGARLRQAAETHARLNPGAGRYATNPTPSTDTGRPATVDTAAADSTAESKDPSPAAVASSSSPEGGGNSSAAAGVFLVIGVPA